MIGSALGVAAACVVLVGYLLYLRGQLRVSIKPNLTSWTLWTFGEAITILVYGEFTSDISKLFVPIACLAGSSLILVMAMRTGSFVVPSRFEIGLGILDLIILSVWVSGLFPIGNYLLLLVSTFLSFVPILATTHREPTNESAPVWWIWTVGYGLFLALAFVEWEGWQSVALPALYCLLNASVAFFAAQRRVSNAS